VALALVVAACANPNPSPSNILLPRATPTRTAPRPTDAFDALASRALAPPDLVADPCPVDALSEVDDRIAPALGPGPIYPVMGSGRVSLTGAARGAFDRYHLKTLWVSTDPVDERILIRVTVLGSIDVRSPGLSGGHALVDGIATQLRLGPVASLRFSPGPMPEGWRAWSSNTLVDGPGCYAFQIDTARATAHVVFEVVP
jgi:hypothetical protein